MLLYDNIEDVKSKLIGTLVYYKGKVVVVKDAKQSINGKGYVVFITSQDDNKLKVVKLSDPDLNYTEYNLGYTNYHNDAAWWCRIPIKQWQQGLKQGQCRCYRSKINYDFNPNLGFNGYTINMMEDKYPSFEKVTEHVKAGKVYSWAFHKDFAISWDPVHSDFILDYKGKNIGHMLNKDNINLMEDFQHLAETVKEVIS